jgi:hypothetical protein
MGQNLAESFIFGANKMIAKCHPLDPVPDQGDIRGLPRNMEAEPQYGNNCDCANLV